MSKRAGAIAARLSCVGVFAAALAACIPPPASSDTACTSCKGARAGTANAVVAVEGKSFDTHGTTTPATGGTAGTTPTTGGTAGTTPVVVDAGDPPPPPASTWNLEFPVTIDKYYEKVDVRKSNEALIEDLNNLLSSYTSDVTYNGLWTAYPTTDGGLFGCTPGNPTTNTAPKVFDIYRTTKQGDACWSGGVTPKTTPPTPNNPDDQRCSGVGYSKIGDCYNREHVWPQSAFNSASPAYADLHHVFPTDGKLNNERATFAHGVVRGATADSEGNKKGPCQDAPIVAPATTAPTCFEPADIVKGDIARAYFYMSVRYRGLLKAKEVVASNTGITSWNLEPWFETTMRAWAKADPPSVDEKKRNELVYQLQKNRNPFIDHPEWLDKIANF